MLCVNAIRKCAVRTRRPWAGLGYAIIRDNADLSIRRTRTIPLQIPKGLNNVQTHIDTLGVGRKWAHDRG